MKRYLGIKLFTVMFVLLVVSAPAMAWDISGDWIFEDFDIAANVVFTVNEGGLLWVNNTVIANLTSVWVGNGTTLSFAATPTNSNYSFSGFYVNGTLVQSNPYVYTVYVPANASAVNVYAVFVANPVPTPPDLTVDDSVGLAVAFGLIALVCGVGVSLYLFYQKSQDES